MDNMYLDSQFNFFSLVFSIIKMKINKIKVDYYLFLDK
jgi:hypothetical protein